MKENYSMLVERSFFRTAANSIVLKGTIKGTYDQEKFEDVVKELIRIHPILECVIEEVELGKLAYIRKEGLRFRVSYIKKNTDNQWVELVKSEDYKPYQLSKEPAIRFFVLHNENGFDLVIIAHHILGDGLSYAYLLQDFLELYCNNKELSVQESRLITSLDDFPESSGLDINTQNFIQRGNQEWNEKRILFTQEEYEAMHTSYREKHYIDILVYKLQKEEYIELRRKCKEKKITINTMILTSFLAALRELTEHETEQVTIAVNLRNKLNFDPKRCIGNYASAFSPVFSYNKEIGFWENAENIGTMIKERLNDPKVPFKVLQILGALDASLFDCMNLAPHNFFNFEWLGELLQLLTSDPTVEGMGISNLGEFLMDPLSNGYELEDLVYMPPASSVFNKTVGVVTVGDTLNISISYKEEFIPKDKIEAISKRMLQNLIEA